MQDHYLTTFTLSAFNMQTQEVEPLNHGYIVSIANQPIMSVNIMDGGEHFMFNLNPDKIVQIGNFIAYLTRCPFITRNWENPYEPAAVICQTLRQHLHNYHFSPYGNKVDPSL